VADIGEWWYGIVAPRGGEPARFIRVESRRYPDHARVELSAEQVALEAGDDIVCTATYDEHGRVALVERAPSFAPKAPPLWFVEFRESSAQPPAVSLVAFTGHSQRVGAVFDQADLSSLPVVHDDQLGAIRWYPATGEIDQIYVAPPARRQQIGTALLISAGTLSLARGWPRFWSDGQRTVLGEQLRNSRAWAKSAAELTHIAPPMTPGDPG
jgi:ribosomal protein S18 acetylase RimI-like enzyme